MKARRRRVRTPILVHFLWGLFSAPAIAGGMILLSLALHALFGGLPQ